jgi:hypothetical protein
MIDYDKFVPVLQKLGNNRTAYCIFVDRDNGNMFELMAKACIGMHIKHRTVYMTDALAPLDDEIIDRQDSIFVSKDAFDQLYDIAFAEPILLVVIGHLSELKKQPEHQHLFNEIVTMGDLGGLRFAKTQDYVYLREIITDPDLVAFKSVKHWKEPLIIEQESLEKWEPWHTLLLHKPSNTVLQIIWDLRLIVGVASISSEMANRILGMPNADDNRKLLYCTKPGLLDNYNQITKYLHNKIEVENA